MSHLGRPKGKVSDSLRLRPVAQHLSALLRRPVPATGDAVGLGTEDAVARLKPGQMLLLENLRFHPEEEANDPEFAKQLAAYGDVFVNDAFGTAHRAHASTVGVAELLPAYAGLLMEREIRNMSRLLEDPAQPFAAVIGGRQGLGQDRGPQRAARAGRHVPHRRWHGQHLPRRAGPHGGQEPARARPRRGRGTPHRGRGGEGVKLLLPTDVVVAKEVTRGAEHKIVPVSKIPNSWSAVDIGPETLEAFGIALKDARTVLWNGPLGVFEVPTFGDGTRFIARFLAERVDEGVTVVVGGGDSVAAVQELELTSRITHISTGGGASLEFLEGRELPGIKVLLDRPPLERPKKVKPA